MCARARANALWNLMTKISLKKKLLPFLRRSKMLMTMSCHLMHLCVQAKA